MRPFDPRLLPYLRPARGALAATVAASALGGILIVVQCFALAAVIVGVVDGRVTWTAWWVLLGAFAARSIASLVVDRASDRAASTISASLRQALLGRALSAPASSGSSTSPVGELGVLTTRGVGAIEPYVTRYLPALVTSVVLPALVLFAIASQDWIAGLVVLLTLPLVPLFAALIGLSTKERADRQWRVLSQLSGHFVDVVRGLPTLVAHGRAWAQAPQIRAVTDRYRRANRSLLRLAFASSAALELIATLSVALVAVIVGLRLADGGLDLSTALVVLLLAPEAYAPLRRVGAEFHAAAEGTATFERVHKLLGARRVGASYPASRHDLPTESARVTRRVVTTYPSSRHDLPTESARVTHRVGASSSRATGEAGGNARFGPAPIVIDDLEVAWPGRSTPALTGLSARIPKTGLTVITGPSGCGKSTLLAAILGDLALSGGLIRVGGTDLDSVDPVGWQSSVATASQDPWLLDASIADNVRVGRPDATDEEVRVALSTAALLDWVVQQPDGLDTSVGEDGRRLSAGQRARLALARVVVSDRPWVLLDEPTAHLDAETEEVLLAAIVQLASERCVVAVAHRQALIDAADHVIPLLAPATIPTESSRLTQPVVTTYPPSRHDLPTESSRGTQRVVTSSSQDRQRLAFASLLAVLAATSGVALTATAGWLIARAAEQPPVLALVVAIVGVRTFGLARPALRYAERLVSHDVALRMLAERRARVYDDLVPLVPARRGRRRGDLLASLVDDVDSLLDEQLRVRMPVVTWLGTTAVAAGILLLFSIPAAALVLVVALLGGAGAWALGSRPSPAAAAVDARGALSRRVVELLAGLDALRHWQAGSAALRRVADQDRNLAAARARGATLLALARAWVFLVTGFGVAAMALVVAPLVADGLLSGPVGALLVLAPLAIADVTSAVADAAALRPATAAAQRRLSDLSKRSPAVTDPAQPHVIPDGYAVQLEKACAGWDGAPRALGPVDLDLPEGVRVGVVGPSGSGKSTLAALLVRFLPPSAGRQLLGEVDVATLTAGDVRRVVGLMDDAPYLFGSTLAENVRLARPSADDLQVEEALRRAALGDWLDALPDGLSTRIGDGAASVSGGERARIGIARALLADRPILVVDEPTAHLDHTTAQAITDELLAATAGRSVVWITHGTLGLDQMDEVVQLGRTSNPTIVPG